MQGGYAHAAAQLINQFDAPDPFCRQLGSNGQPPAGLHSLLGLKVQLPWHVVGGELWGDWVEVRL